MRHALFGMALFLAGCDQFTTDVYREVRARMDATDGGTQAVERPDAGVTEQLPDAPLTIRLPAGRSLQGCNGQKLGEACSTAAHADEQPFHAVELSSFELTATEITQASYAACLNAGRCTVPSCDFNPAEKPAIPVTCVTWDAARTYCEWLGMRLPTEAEWEYAAHALDRLYPWGDTPPDCTRAQSAGCASQLGAVGALPQGNTPEGLSDLAGNAAEWVADWYAEDAYAARTGADPTGPANGTQRVVRGGDVTSDAVGILASKRSAAAPGTSNPRLGFRCARSP